MMTNRIKTIFNLWKQYAMMDLLWFARDTRYCLIQIAADTVAALASVSTVLLISARFGGVGGMTADQLLFMSGYAVLTDGILMMFFGGSNVVYVSRIIGRGQLDHTLIQPVPIWMQFLTEGFIPFSGNSKLVCGMILTFAAISKLHLQITALWLACFLFSLICSTAVIVATVYIISCCAFFCASCG